MARDGNGKRGHEIDEELIARSLEEPCLFRCLRCDWTLTAPAREGIEASRAHRAEVHGVRAKPKRVRPARHGAPKASTSNADVFDNLARARAAGAGEGAARHMERELAVGRQVCKHDGCMLAPVEQHGRFAGLCHEHKLERARKRRKAAA